MAEDTVDPAIIKRTQNLLQSHFQKPPLTEKLLKKPPFRFLHDIVTSVIKETGFLSGLYSKEELISENFKEKNAKIKFLTKLIKVMEIVHGNQLSAKPNKIVAGLEPTKTNELLQSIGLALKAKLNSKSAIEQYKKSLKSKSKESEGASKTSVKSISNVKKPSSKIASKTEEKSSKEIKKKSIPVDNFPVEPKISEIKQVEEVQEQNTANLKKISSFEADGEGVTSQLQLPVEDKKPKSSRRQSTSKTRNEESNYKQNASKSVDLVNENDAVKGTVSNFEQNSASNALSNTVSTNAKPEENNNSNKEQTLKTEMHKEKVSAHPSQPRGIDLRQNIKSAIKTKQSAITRTNSAIRPTSVRPSSSRPAAPRIHIIQDNTVNENAYSFGDNTANVFAEEKTEDDANDMVIIKNQIDSYQTSDQTLANLDEEHGHLVAQILETQKELINSSEVSIIPIEYEAKHDKQVNEATVAQVEKLRKNIQHLTRSTNPLGKLLDFLQENIEIMRKEILDWSRENENYENELQNKKKMSEKSMEPIQQLLQQVNENIKEEKKKIDQCKLNIIKNNEKIRKSVNGFA